MIYLVPVVFGLIGVLLGQSKNRQVEGFFLGFLLNVIGLIILLFVPPKAEDAPPPRIGNVFFGLLLAIGGIAAMIYYIDHSAEEREVAERFAADHAATAALQQQTASAHPATPAPVPPPHTPSPQELAAARARESAQRAAQEAAEIAKKYGAH